MPNGPGSYFQNIDRNIIQNSNGFNQTSLRFEKGGKNNTKEAIDEYYENKIGLNAIISTYIPRDSGENNLKSIHESNNSNFNNEYKTRKNKDYLGKNKRKNRVGPGSYEYSSERYPCVKPSFNVKYI